jgi:hypothetical protein
MKPTHRTQLVRYEHVVAQVDLEPADGADPWGPTASLEEAVLIQQVHHALRDQRLGDAANLARLYRLEPIGGSPAAA